MDTFLLSFWSSPNHSVKIKIFLLTWCKVVLSYAYDKSKPSKEDEQDDRTELQEED